MPRLLLRRRRAEDSARPGSSAAGAEASAARESSEQRAKPLISGRGLVVRQGTWALFSLAVVAASLAIGAIVYRATEELGWLDATHQAAMILTGMGPMVSTRTDAGKVFETCFALFSGGVFLSEAAMLLAPIAHRIRHRFHLEADVDAR